MIPAATERNYPKRLLKAGWWHTSLFHQPARSQFVGTIIKGQTLMTAPILTGVPRFAHSARKISFTSAITSGGISS